MKISNRTKRASEIITLCNRTSNRWDFGIVRISDVRISAFHCTIINLLHLRFFAVIIPCQVASKKLSEESLGRQKSPHDDKQNRQGSPAGGGSGPTCEDEDEEEGNHDTITSLAGAKMMQWYHKALTGSRKSSNVSLNQVLKLKF